MIVINEIKEKSCLLYYEDKLIGEVKDLLSFNDIRIQISKNKLEGYSVLFDNCYYELNKDGNIFPWPRGLFDKIDEQLNEIIGLNYGVKF